MTAVSDAVTWKGKDECLSGLATHPPPARSRRHPTLGKLTNARPRECMCGERGTAHMDPEERDGFQSFIPGRTLIFPPKIPQLLPLQGSCARPGTNVSCRGGWLCREVEREGGERLDDHRSVQRRSSIQADPPSAASSEFYDIAFK
ncbi:unnamed protein product, partial [Gadus morhua 'NCC']